MESSDLDPVICGENATRVDFDCGVACITMNMPGGGHRQLTFNEYLTAVDWMNESCAPSVGLYPGFN